MVFPFPCGVNRSSIRHLLGLRWSCSPAPPEHVEVGIWRTDEWALRRGLTSALDAMGSDVGKKAEPRWRWQETVLRARQELCKPLGILRLC
jgi:hypothetical protein